MKTHQRFIIILKLALKGVVRQLLFNQGVFFIDKVKTDLLIKRLH